jgi:catechol 2,3-dioxygenase-like lactoylglutathione lyase family enzyme
MQKDTAYSNDFPTQGVELRCVLVVSDYTRGLTFYRDVLGATVIHELDSTLCELRFAGSQILLVVPKDLPATHTGAILDLSIQVPDCQAAYQLLRARGAEFLTLPFKGREKTQAFFLDPDGHLIEIWQAWGK